MTPDNGLRVCHIYPKLEQAALNFGASVGQTASMAPGARAAEWLWVTPVIAALGAASREALRLADVLEEMLQGVNADLLKSVDVLLEELYDALLCLTGRVQIEILGDLRG